MDFEFDDEELMLPPPPLSLSAPELSAQPPTVPVMKRSVSSTELLYEKAMARFYKAMELDEREQLKRTSVSVERVQPKMITTTTGKPMQPTLTKRDSIGSSIDRGLERKSSLRRRLSGEVPEVNISFAGLKSSRESITRMSASPKRSLYPQESLDDPEYLSHVDEYTDDYTESTASSDESETEKFKRRVREHGQPKRSLTEDELDTYHPRNRMTSPYTSPESDQAVEVLSKPYSPNPDFIPKPILKRPSSAEGDFEDKKVKSKGAKPKTHRKPFSKLFERKGSSGGETEENKEKMGTPEKVQDEPVKSEDTTNRRESITNREKANKLKMEMRQSSFEEQKVAIDHYSDLVREKGNWRTAAAPLYLNADELKKAAGAELVDEADDLEFELRHQVQIPDDTPMLSPSTRILKQPTSSEGVQQIAEKIPESPEVPKDIGLDLSGRPTRDLQKQVPRRGSSTSRVSGGSRNSSAVRRTGKTPVEARVASKTRERSTSKSPLSVNRRPLAMKGQDPANGDLRRTPTPSLSRPMTPQEELEQQQAIDTKVKFTMSYTTDLVLFVVACWMYLFKDARLALPIVVLLIYRHIRDHLPRWMFRKAE